ncbi:MAG: type III-B CRISPR module-associated protein Cmr5 [Firmicutes bacterium]|nr:type III-B CRISPR module-associated protein Cmr5 [Bacillota bacterium]
MLLEQQRASYALSYVKEMLKVNSDQQAKYVTLVQGAPAMIIANGLGQTVAFWLDNCQNGRGNHHHDASWLLYNHLSGWLTDKRHLYTPSQDQQRGLLGLIIDGNTDQYLAAQEESLALLAWLKRFAVAFLKPVSDSRSGVKDNVSGSSGNS